MNVEAIVAQLPAHLQLEVHLELNKKLVLQVHMFAGCAREFFDALVIKLQPCICVAGDYVFYDGEVGNKKVYDPRSYLKKAEQAMSERVVEACNDLKSAGKSKGAKA